QDYSKATECLLNALGIAERAGNPGWQGWVVHRQAIVAARLKKYQEALQEYLEAARFCGEAKDSLCVAESLEQVSVMYGSLQDFENAERYHVIAMPLIEKYGGETQLGAALNNYGNINSWAGRYAPAVRNYERAIAVFQKLGKPLEIAKAKNNLADAYKYLHRYAEAKAILEECMDINQKNNFLQSLMTNYANLSVLYDSMGNYRQAFLYLHDYHYLKDSLIGAETQQKIAELQVKYEAQQKELELERSKSALTQAQRSVEKLLLTVFFVLVLAVAGLWRWWWLNRQAKQELAKNKETLEDLTRILLEKNTQLVAQKMPVQKAPAEIPEAGWLTASGLEPHVSKAPAESPEPPLPADFESNFFEQHILTDADWASFKAYFEKAHPGFLQRLRSKHPSLTDAEERLFLFVKLNLTTKEIAAMLGISTPSVKKTRNRLRKKLELGEEVELEEYVRGF
ncbi:MAG: transcriptional regulator, partial [Bacteroidota bacterium]